MPTFTCTIRGLTPMLIHRWSEEAEETKTTRAVHIERRNPREEALKVCYRREDGTMYFPGAAIARMLREAGGSHKQRGSRKSIKFIVPAAIVVLEDQITILDLNGKPLKNFEVDSRPVTIPATRGRIMRHRPRFNVWQAEVTLQIEPDLIDPTLAHQLLEEGGRRVGVGDFRPEKGGPFGRFEIIRWAELQEKPLDKKPSRLKAV